jgi:hypothetical protein
MGRRSRRLGGSAAAHPKHGIRDLLLGVGLLQALNQADHPTAARWLSYGAAAGVIDAGATLAAYPSLPRGGRAFLLFITGALIGDTLLAAQLRSHDNEQDGSPAGGPQAPDALASSEWERLLALRMARDA